MTAAEPNRGRPAGATGGPVLRRLEEGIGSRKARRPDGSYVVHLLDGGSEAIGAKVVEEAREAAEAAAAVDQAGTEPLVGELADLVFHALVLAGEAGVTLADVERELERRFGVGGFEEKAAR